MTHRRVPATCGERTPCRSPDLEIALAEISIRLADSEICQQ